MSLGVGQLDGLDPAQVVVVSSPLAVARLLREGGLEDQLVRLVVEVVVEIVPQQTVDEDGLECKKNNLTPWAAASQRVSPDPRSRSSALPSSAGCGESP